MGKKNRRSANLISQGGFMAVLLFAVWSLLVLRNLPLTALWGDEGSSMYSAAYGIFTAAWLISSYGLPAALSQLIRERNRQGQYKNAAKILKTAFFYAFVTGAVLGGLMFAGSAYLMDGLLMEPLGRLSLQIFSAAVLISAWNGVLRGFFLGNGAGFPVAVSMLIEQLLAFLAGFPAARFLSGYGKKVGDLLQNEAFEKSFASAGFSAGILAGCIFSLLFLLSVYLLSRSYYRRKNSRDAGYGREGVIKSTAVFFAALFPVLFYGLFMKGYLLLEQIMFRQFMKDGLGSLVISQQWGCFFGKYKVLTALPVIYAMALGSALGDNIRMLGRKSAYQHMREVIQSRWKVIMTAVIPYSVLIGVLARPLCGILFQGQDFESAVSMLLTGFLSAVFFAGAYLFGEMLRGLGKGGILTICGMAALIFGGIMLYLMLEILHLDIHGVLYADLLYSLFLMLLTGIAVLRCSSFRLDFFRIIMPSAFSALIMGIILFLAEKALSAQVSAPLLFGILLAAGLVIYHLVLLLLKGISARELLLLPGGKWILSAAKAVRLL